LLTGAWTLHGTFGVIVAGALLLMPLAFAAASGQDQNARPGSATAQNAAAIRAIRARYAQVNRDVAHGTRVVRRDLPGYSVEGGSLEGYFSGPTLARWSPPFPAKRGTLSRSSTFGMAGCSSSCAPRRFMINRSAGWCERNRIAFYFERGRLIQWLDAKNKPVALSGPAVRRRERDLLGDARTFATLLRRPAASPG
jgi:hypothetical protein